MADQSNERMAQRLFCPQCFADDRSGSWGAGVTGTAGGGSFCENCCASNSAVPMPQWAVDSIRAQASWVGRRYYPGDEDRADRAELEYLRAVAPDPACEAKQDAEVPMRWWVTQGRIQSMFTASSEADAKRQAKLRMAHPVPAGFDGTARPTGDNGNG